MGLILIPMSSSINKQTNKMEKFPLVEYKGYKEKGQDWITIQGLYETYKQNEYLSWAVYCVNGKVGIDWDSPLNYELFFKDVDTLTTGSPSGGYHSFCKTLDINTKSFNKMGFEYKVNELCTIIGKGYALVKDLPIKEFENLKSTLDLRTPEFKKPKNTRVQIYDVMAKYGVQKINENHGSFTANCPFHENDTKGHMEVYKETNQFHCHKCKVHGNAIDYIMRIENVKLSAALKIADSLVPKQCGDCLFQPNGEMGFCRNPDADNKKTQQKRHVSDTDKACEFFEKTKDPSKKEYTIPQEEVSGDALSIDVLIKKFKESIYVEEDLTIILPFAFAISAFSPIDPDVLGIVAPSGSGKTEVIRSLGDTENQYIYPLSSITSHTFISGLKEGNDLAPQLQNRLVSIKDFTTILSKDQKEVSQIFADIRDITDGYLQKVFGSEVGKKEYKDLHSSFLFACTNAIERYYSLYSMLGQRIIFFRPKSNARESRRKAITNSGNEKKIRENHHSLAMRLMNTVLTTKKDRLDNITHSLSEEMKERIGILCEFLAIVRTHINRDLKGDMACLPEPEMPTRLTKTLCKLVDAHSILYDRIPTEQDEFIAYRLVHDNIPTERNTVLKVLACLKEPKPTSQIATAAKIPTSMASRVLNDLAALDLVTRFDKTTFKSNSDAWQFTDGDYKNAFLDVISQMNKAPDSENLKGVNPVGSQEPSNVDLISYDLLCKNKENKEEKEKIPLDYLPELHPSTFQEAQKESLEEKIEKSGKFWENLNSKFINSSNMTDFCIWYCEQNKNGHTPAEIRKTAEKIFKITPENKITIEDNGETFEVMVE